MDEVIAFLQRYGVLLSSLAGTLTILGFLFTLYRAKHDKEVSHLKNRIAELEERIAELEKHSHLLEARVKDLGNDRDSANSDARKARELAERYKSKARHGELDHQDFQKRLSVATQTIDELRQTVARSDDEARLRRQELHDLERRLENEKQSAARLATELQTASTHAAQTIGPLQTELRAGRDASDAQTRTISQLQTDLRAARDASDAQVRTISQIQSDLRTARDGSQAQARTIKQLQTDLQTTREQAEAQGGIIAQFQRDLQGARQAGEAATRMIESLRREASQNDREAKPGRDELQRQVQEVKSNLSAREQEVATLVTKAQADKAEMQRLAGEIQRLDDRSTNGPRLPPVAEIERCWERPIGPEGIPFPPVSARKTKIISVLNLKGGVGKTTITANLGATLWKNSSVRLLLIDLDFQGTLTARCLDELGQERTQDQKWTAEDYFLRAMRDPSDLAGALRKRIQPVVFERLGDRLLDTKGRGSLLAADEPLADVETSLMVRWLLGDCADVRFLLRRALHNAALADAYDCVLIDCPPRLTTACVNALACSDAVLVPVVLDNASTARVPQVLGWIMRLRNCGICPNLTRAGVVANLVTRVGREQDVWKELPGTCANIWSGEPLFATQQISRHAQIGIAADEHFPAVLRGIKPFDALRTEFEGLANELRREGFVP